MLNGRAERKPSILPASQNSSRPINMVLYSPNTSCSLTRRRGNRAYYRCRKLPTGLSIGYCDPLNTFCSPIRGRGNRAYCRRRKLPTGLLIGYRIPPAPFALTDHAERKPSVSPASTASNKPIKRVLHPPNTSCSPTMQRGNRAYCRRRKLPTGLLIGYCGREVQSLEGLR